MKKRPLIQTRRSIADLMEELNKFALSVDEPLSLIKWAVKSIPETMDCEMAHLGLVEPGSVVSMFGISSGSTHLKRSFISKIRSSYKKNASLRRLVWREPLPDMLLPSSKNKAKAVASYYFHPLILLNQVVGSVAVASSKKGSFPAYQLNLLETLCDQLSLGLKSLIDKDIIRRQSEQIAEEKRTFEAIACGMNEGLVLLDKEHRPLAVNPVAREMLSVEGKSTSDREIVEIILSQLSGNDVKKRPLKKDLSLLKPRKRIINLSTTPIFEKGGLYHGMSVLLTDVTHEREIEQMKSDFVSAVSHELRTPLASIREAVALVYDGVSGEINERQRKCLDIAVRNSDRLGRLIGDLLNLSRIEAGKVVMKRTAVAVVPIVKSVITGLRPVAEKAGITVINGIMKEPPNIFADPDQLVQVLTNLIGNSLKFTPEGGSVTIEARSVAKGQVPSKGQRALASDHVLISVADTGPGIPREDQQKLFQRFAQLDTGLTRRPGGTGLGLSISKEIVLKHNGRIWVEPKVEIGSKFSFVIPVFHVDMIYLDIIQQEIDRVRSARSNLYVIILRPLASEKGVLERLEEVCKGSVSQSDVVLKYQGKYIVVVAELDMKGVKEMIDAFRLKFTLGFESSVAGYPQDGMTAEEIMEKLIK